MKNHININNFSQPSGRHSTMKMLVIITILTVSIIAAGIIIYRSSKRTGTKTTVMYTTEGGVVMVERYIDYGS